jgi:hypothetical protein
MFQTNHRYYTFKQKHFTAGDEEQFLEKIIDVCQPGLHNDNIERSKLFNDIELNIWDGYRNTDAATIVDTFRYIMHKFKKGVFVKIYDNKVETFLPFSHGDFKNEWSHKIKVEPSMYRNLSDFLSKVSTMTGYKFNPHKVDLTKSRWYANNCLLRYEYPLAENDTNISTIKHMLEELCSSRRIPDTEFFINKRDFPILTRNGTEPYFNIWGPDVPLVSHNYKKFTPILSMCVSNNNADISIPTHEDWNRIMYQEGINLSKRSYDVDNDIEWHNKKPVAVFRGSSTGCGVDIETNPRLRIAYMSSKGCPYLDAGITKWNVRPRKIMGNSFLQTIDINNLPFELVKPLSYIEQAKYKYIVNIDGHSSAFRLSVELGLGSVVLLVQSKWELWIHKLIKPYIHYIPIKADLSDLIEKIQWCMDNDDECQRIVRNARCFYETYLSKNAVLDYMQMILVECANTSGRSDYNQIPIYLQINNEHSELTTNISYPITCKNVLDINTVPDYGRSFGMLKGIEWIFNMMITTDKSSLISDNIAGYRVNLKQHKSRDFIHGVYIGTKDVNTLLRHIPNFSYTFGMYENEGIYYSVHERIYGCTLSQYINNSSMFDFYEFIYIIANICFALEIAQNECGFVHYNLTPRNIILMPNSSNRLKVNDYILSEERVVRIHSRYTPVIVNYSKARTNTYGFVNKKFSTIQDVLTLIISSIHEIINIKHENKPYFGDIVKLLNFISYTGFRKDEFVFEDETRKFLNKSRCYYTMVLHDKYELDEATPLSFVGYLRHKFPNALSSISDVESYENSMNTCNPRQVFDFILSCTNQERIQSFLNVPKRIVRCALPNTNNIVVIKFAKYMLKTTLITTMNCLRRYTNDKKHDKYFFDAINHVQNIYSDIKDIKDIQYDTHMLRHMILYNCHQY